MKNIKMIIAVFTFVAAAIGLIVAAVYFIDRKCGLFSHNEEEEDCDCGDEYFTDDLSFEDSDADDSEEESAEGDSNEDEQE